MDKNTPAKLDNIIVGIEKAMDFKPWTPVQREFLAMALEHAVRAKRQFLEGNEKKACMNLRISMDCMEEATGKKARRTA